MIKRSVRRFAVLLVSILLVGCVNQPLKPVVNWNEYQRRVAAVDSWQLRGSLRIKTANDIEKSKIHWHQQQDNFNIRLWAALGLGTIKVVSSDSGVQLERSGEETVFAKNAEELLRDYVGIELPINELQYWVRGVPAPYGSQNQTQISEGGWLERLNQSGWSLQYQSYQRIGDWNLPSRLSASREDIEITLRVVDWTFPDAEPINKKPAD